MLYADVTNGDLYQGNMRFGDLYQGNMRFDVNISVAEKGAKELGTRTEIKNLNSFKSVERVVDYEFERQTKLLENGEKVKQETRGWDDNNGKTMAQRNKEVAADYRYMPDPDIPPIVLDQSYVEAIKEEMQALPNDYRKKFAVLGLTDAEREAILNYPILARRLEGVTEKDAILATRVAHWFSGILLAEDNLDKDFGLATVAELSELSSMVENKELSSTAGKEVFLALYDRKNTSKTPHALAKEMNLIQENDLDALGAIVDSVLGAPECQKAVNDVRNGEEKAIGFLVGQVMKKSAGKANPAVVNQLIKQKLS